MPDILTLPIFILWLFSADPWGSHAGHFSAGWVPHGAFYGISKCNAGAAGHRVTMKKIKLFMCQRYSDTPPFPIAEPIERYAK